MKRFNFKLQKLLDYRTHLEKVEQDKFSKVLSKYVSIENVIETATEKRKDVLLDSRSFLERGDLALFYYRDFARKGLKTKMAEYGEKLKEQVVPLNKARQELIETVKNKRMIEILKDKAKVAYQKEAEKEEQDELDEFSATMALKKKVRLF